jgi:Zn-dependent protease/predicted transcriptional regulator
MLTAPAWWSAGEGITRKMGGSFKIGRLFGIDVKIHWTFFLLLAFFAFLGYQGAGELIGALGTTALIAMLFLSVLLHEYGHSLVAQRLGIEIRDITLLPIGGVSNMRTLPEKPSEEIKITLAGPLVNVVLAPIFYGIGVALGADPLDITSPLGGFASAGQFFIYLGVINVALAIFNLIPAFPMDGGRVLRGLLATRLGRLRATNIASIVGQVFAAVFFFIGLLGGNIILALIAVFVFLGAGGEAEMVRQREMARGLTVADVMGTKRRIETVSPHHTFGQVLDLVLHGYQEDFPVVDEGGELVGMLTRKEIFSAARSPDGAQLVRELMRTEFPIVSPEADLFSDGNRILQESDLRAVPVAKSGELVGMLTVDDVGQASLLQTEQAKATAE